MAKHRSGLHFRTTYLPWGGQWFIPGLPVVQAILLRISETPDSTTRRRSAAWALLQMNFTKCPAAMTSRIYRSSFTISLCTAALSLASINFGSILVRVSLSPAPRSHWSDVAYMSRRRQLSFPAGVPELMAHDPGGIWEIPRLRGEHPCGWVAWRLGCHCLATSQSRASSWGSAYAQWLVSNNYGLRCRPG
jgi:hypothetical protein